MSLVTPLILQLKNTPESQAGQVTFPRSHSLLMAESRFLDSDFQLIERIHVSAFLKRVLLPQGKRKRGKIMTI